MATTLPATAFSQSSIASPSRPITDANVEDKVPIIDASSFFLKGGLYSASADRHNVNVVESLHPGYGGDTENTSLSMPFLTSTPHDTLLTYNFNTSQSQNLWQQNELFARHMIPVMVFVALLMAIGLPGNCLVVYVYGFRFKPATQNVLIVCLACLDLVMCLVAMPSEIADMRFHHTFSNEFACKVLRFMTMYVSMASCLTLISVAYDRHKRITQPLSRQMTPRGAKTWVAFNFIASLLLAWPTFLMTGLRPSQTKIAGLYGKDCSYTEQFADTKYPLLFNCVLAVGFLINIGALSILYFRIWKAARTRKINMAKRYTITSLSESSHNDFKGDLVAETQRDFLCILRKHPSIDNTNLAFQHNLHPGRPLWCQSSNSKVNWNESAAFDIRTLVGAIQNEASDAYAGHDVFAIKSINKSVVEDGHLAESKKYKSFINETKGLSEQSLYDEKEYDDIEKNDNQICSTCHQHSPPDLLVLAKRSNFKTASDDSYNNSVPSFNSSKFPDRSSHLSHAQSSTCNSSKMTICSFCKGSKDQQTSSNRHKVTDQHIGRYNNATFNSSFSSESDLPNFHATVENDYQTARWLSESRDSFNFDEHEHSMPSHEGQPNSLGNAKDHYLELDVIQLSERTPADIPPDFCKSSCTIQDSSSANDLYAYDAEITLDEEDRRVNVGFILDSFSHLIGPAIKPMDLPAFAREEQSELSLQRMANFTNEGNSTDSVVEVEGKCSSTTVGNNEREDFGDGDGNQIVNGSAAGRRSRVSEDWSVKSHGTNLTSLSRHSIDEDIQVSKWEPGKTRCQSGSSRADLNLPCPASDRKRTFFLGSLDKTTVVALAVSCVFVLSFLPYLILMSIRGLDRSYYHNLDWTSLCIYQLFLRFYFLNSASNPILYGLLNTNFRRECCAIWRALISCCYQKVKVDHG